MVEWPIIIGAIIGSVIGSFIVAIVKILKQPVNRKEKLEIPKNIMMGGLVNFEEATEPAGLAAEPPKPKKKYWNAEDNAIKKDRERRET